jgi:alpha-beta hydrolase superfamily lysophospholipase
MIVDLAGVTTSDGIKLDGAFLEPAKHQKSGAAIDAVLAIHGSTGNFYTASTLGMAEDLSLQGYAALSLNTTAHDTVWYNRSDNAYYGVAYEMLDRCRLDLRAGIDHLWERGYRRIAILGQSMGAVRVVYYAANEEDDRVKAVIPVSPVRLSYSYYMASEDAAEFQANIDRADQMEAEGRAMDLFPVNFPIPQMFSAAAYLDKHGPAERYNIITHAPRVKAPMLAVAGSLETHTRLLDAAKDLATAAVNSPRADYAIIEGGDHSLTNRRQEAADTVLAWLASLTPQTALA